MKIKHANAPAVARTMSTSRVSWRLRASLAARLWRHPNVLKCPAGVVLTASSHTRTMPSTSERDVTKQVIGFLQAEGWRCLRMTVSFNKRRFSTGEKGMPDWLCLKYTTIGHDCDILWVEMKKPGEKQSKAQLKWADNEELFGARIVVADNLDTFREWYREDAQ